MLPEHDESPSYPVTSWCSRSRVVRALKADDKKRGVYDPKDWP